MRLLKQAEIDQWALHCQRSVRRQLAAMHPSCHADFLNRCILEITMLLNELEGEFPEPVEEPEHATTG